VKILIKKIITKLLEAFYIYCYYHTRIDDQVILLESKKGQDVASNIFYILKQLNIKYPKHKIYLSIKASSLKETKEFLDSYDIKNIHFVLTNSFRYLYILSKAKYLFNDTTFPVLFIKKEGQVYTNTWHGTPLKKMGNDDVNKYNIGNVKRNFLMCDNILFPNVEMDEKMRCAYDLDNLYKGNIINSGYPRNAIFYDDSNHETLKDKYDLEDKRVLVYMPTYREKETNIIKIHSYLSYLDKHLNQNDVLFVKLHVLDSKVLNFDKFKRVKPFPTDIEVYSFLSIADILISDYSSVIFDYACCHKKIILFAYDLEHYIENRGLYYKINQLGLPVVESISSLLEEINQPNTINYQTFNQRFNTYDSINATTHLLDYVLKDKLDDSVKIRKLTPNGKKNTIFFISSMDLNGVTSSIISMINLIDLNKENYYFTFFTNRLKDHPERLDQLGHDISVFPILKGFNYSIKEMFASFLYYYLNIETKFVNKYLTRHYQREGLRIYGSATFNKAIQYTGYHPAIIRLFQEMPSKRAIWVHNDMNKEIKERKIKSYLIYKSAYTNYDKVVGVSQIAIDSAISISGRKDNTCIIYNPFDQERVLQLSKEDFKFDSYTVSNFEEEDIKTILKSKYDKFINLARFSKEKGQQRLIDAFNEYYKNHPKTYLFIVGGHGPLFEELMDYTEKLECKDNVVFIRSLSNPFSLLKQMNLFILSSFYEGLGLVLLEANVLDIPSFSTDIAGPRELMIEHHGCLVEDSQEGLYQGMLDYKEGKIHTFDYDVDKYNKKIKEEFEGLF